MKLMKAAEFGSTGAALMSRFHQLSDGNSGDGSCPPWTGAPANVPLGIVGRFVSTKVMVMTPTPYEPGCSTCALVRGAAVGVAVGDVDSSLLIR